MNTSNHPPSHSSTRRADGLSGVDTDRKNLNRGFMKLEVWQRGMDLFSMAFELCQTVQDWKLKSQILDATQSVSSNIAEGYGRRTLPEYIFFLYYAKGSLAESLTRAIGLKRIRLISPQDFEAFDVLHYEVENKLLNLISRLETDPSAQNWQSRLPPHRPHTPLEHSRTSNRVGG